MMSISTLFLKPDDPVIALHPDTLLAFYHHWTLSPCERQVLDEHLVVKTTSNIIITRMYDDIHIEDHGVQFDISYFNSEIIDSAEILISFRRSKFLNISVALVRFAPPLHIFNSVDKWL